MAKDNKGNGKFKTWWTGLKSEFSKIIWLNRKTVIKQTVVVLVVTVIVGILITVIDFYCQLGLKKLVNKAMQQETSTTQKGQNNSEKAEKEAITSAQKATEKAKQSGKNSGKKTGNKETKKTDSKKKQ